MNPLVVTLALLVMNGVWMWFLLRRWSALSWLRRTVALAALVVLVLALVFFGDIALAWYRSDFGKPVIWA